MTDEDVYIKYPRQREWFNKLWIAELMGYDCGPAGVDVPKAGTYVVRPIYNLSGMGIGAEVKQLDKGDLSTPPGYFWCEYLRGSHYSVNYKWQIDHRIGGKWIGINCWEGVNMPINLTKFVEWKRSAYIPELPKSFAAVKAFEDLGEDVKTINVEFIDDNPIEVHLRHSTDPAYDHIIPVWASDLGVKKEHMKAHGFDFVSSYDNADGHLKDPRIGFLVK